MWDGAMNTCAKPERIDNACATVEEQRFQRRVTELNDQGL